MGQDSGVSAGGGRRGEAEGGLCCWEGHSGWRAAGKEAEGFWGAGWSDVCSAMGQEARAGLCVKLDRCLDGDRCLLGLEEEGRREVAPWVYLTEGIRLVSCLRQI